MLGASKGFSSKGFSVGEVCAPVRGDGGGSHWEGTWWGIRQARLEGEELDLLVGGWGWSLTGTLGLAGMDAVVDGRGHRGRGVVPGLGGATESAESVLRLGGLGAAAGSERWPDRCVEGGQLSSVAASLLRAGRRVTWLSEWYAFLQGL